MGQVIKTGALEGGKVAAAAFVQSFIVVMERIGPSIGDVLADALSGAFSKALEGYENPLTGQPFKFAKSITGQLADARRQLEELQSPQHLAGGAVVRDVDTPQIREAQQRILQLQAMRRAEEAERSARVTHAVRSWRTEVGAAMGEFDASLSPLTERLGSLLGGSAFVGPPLILDVVKDMTQGFAFAGDEAQKAAPKVKTLLELLSGRAAAFRSANDLRARELTATGRGDDAARLSMLSRFSSEMQQAIGESSDLAAALARVQSIELRRFDLDRSAAAAVRQLTEADAEYRAGLERRSQLVQAGTIDEFQATRQNQQAAQSLRGIAAAAKEMIADLQASNPEFAAVLATYQQTIKQTLDTIGQDARATGSTIGDGLSEGWREFIREAEDHRKQGREIFDSMADSVTGRLASALVDGASNFDTFGQVIRDWASNALRDIATVITRILLLRAIAGIGGGIAGAYANSVSVGIANSGALAVARTGGLVGRDGRISLRGYARGGEIAGPRHHWRDSQIIAAMPGEFMLNRRTVDRIGTARLNHANQGGDLGGSGGGGVSINFAPTISIQGGGGSRPEEMRQQGKVIVDAMFEHLSRSAAGRAALREMLR
jgi:lambda family phage tail tape measure protein